MLTDSCFSSVEEMDLGLSGIKNITAIFLTLF